MKPSENFEPKNHAETSGDTAVQHLQLFEQNGIDVVVDGGWGVDALLGEQTSPTQRFRYCFMAD
jgi:lincosamide nucleotidyltransferase A/C/D/E